MSLSRRLLLATPALLLARQGQAQGQAPGRFAGLEVKLGAIVPSSGPFAEWGRTNTVALRLVEEQVNAAGGIGGAKLSITIYDDAARPAQAGPCSSRASITSACWWPIWSGPSNSTAASWVRRDGGGGGGGGRAGGARPLALGSGRATLPGRPSHAPQSPRHPPRPGDQPRPPRRQAALPRGLAVDRPGDAAPDGAPVARPDSWPPDARRARPPHLRRCRVGGRPGSQAQRSGGRVHAVHEVRRSGRVSWAARALFRGSRRARSARAGPPPPLTVSPAQPCPPAAARRSFSGTPTATCWSAESCRRGGRRRVVAAAREPRRAAWQCARPRPPW